jgi:NAD(P)-dependent dehydrogenase (short-subunit alcohol dehydrogenase family)
VARGIGRELAFRFSKLGAKIACLDVDEIGNRETATIIKQNGGTAADYKCDVSKKDQVKNVHKKVVQDLGPVDILINNAAIVWGYSYINPFADQFIEDLINVNIVGQIWVSARRDIYS